MMPSKKKPEKASRSRSRSTSRSRATRSSSRTRQSSRSRASESAAKETRDSPAPATKSSITKKSYQTKKKSTTSSEAGDGDVREDKVVNAVSTRVETEKTVDNNEVKKAHVSTTETITRHTSSTVSESVSNTSTGHFTMQLRERRGAGDYSETKTSASESKQGGTESVSKKKKHVMGGPWLPILLTIAIPILSIYLTLMCTKKSCVPRKVSPPSRLTTYWNLKTFVIFVGFVIFQAALCLIPFGRIHKGLVSKNGTRLNYRCNGFIGLLITLLFIVGLVLARNRWPQRIPSVTIALDHFLALQTSAIILALLTGIFVYVSSRFYARENDLNPVGNSGNWFYDACVGHELYPRLFRGLDLKFFTLARLSLIAMATLDILFLVKDVENRGGWNAPVNVPLVLVTMQQFIYVADTLFFEDAFLTTFAMQSEGFGLIHCFTRLVWTPFITTIPARYLMYLGTKDSPSWPSYAYAGIILLHLLAFVIHRGAISQKADYRRDPYHPAFNNLDTVPVSSNKRLIAGGWWGLVRHPNYLGELLLFVSWTLPVGLKMTTPWLCPLLLLLTFVVRIRMVENDCAERYGNGWKTYCLKVRSRLVPFIL